MGRSVIQQRISIDRQRVVGIVLLCLGVLGTGLGVWSSIARGPGVPISAVVFAAWVVAGVVALTRSRRRRIALEREHGPGAGVQRPVR
ncbi:hypothetical protein [Herbiconiux flava]|uniref:Uncharacterized protein n=1 Tax=Herbiconiux flava TaxID=881268 RepID=A0A852SSL3_9MICO|nr:hypothetical protein [Herbiconiux flava]NYD71906.1 hypothetical protein [Herbiconiux flava]GLK18131.1 hypothetical protein GCM10017602_26130 [Herbiconiux flava]